MKPFIDGVGSSQPDGTKYLSSGSTSLLASIVQVGELVGSLSAGAIGVALGRRGTLVSACALVTLGTIIQLTSTSRLGVFVGGRLVLGMGIGQISNCVPLYLSEVSNVHIRGITVGSWQLMLAIGQVIGAGVDQGTQGIPSSASYRIPIALNVLIPLAVFTFIAFIPESPHWLITKPSKAEATKKALMRINKSQPDFSPEQDYEHLREAHEIATTENDGSWHQVFFDAIERRKAFCVFGILAGQQVRSLDARDR